MHSCKKCNLPVHAVCSQDYHGEHLENDDAFCAGCLPAKEPVNGTTAGGKGSIDPGFEETKSSTEVLKNNPGLGDILEPPGSAGAASLEFGSHTGDAAGDDADGNNAAGDDDDGNDAAGDDDAGVKNVVALPVFEGSSSTVLGSDNNVDMAATNAAGDVAASGTPPPAAGDDALPDDDAATSLPVGTDAAAMAATTTVGGNVPIGGVQEGDSTDSFISDNDEDLESGWSTEEQLTSGRARMLLGLAVNGRDKSGVIAQVCKDACLIMWTPVPENGRPYEVMTVKSVEPLVDFQASLLPGEPDLTGMFIGAWIRSEEGEPPSFGRVYSFEVDAEYRVWWAAVFNTGAVERIVDDIKLIGRRELSPPISVARGKIIVEDIASVQLIV